MDENEEDDEEFAKFFEPKIFTESFNFGIGNIAAEIQGDEEVKLTPRKSRGYSTDIATPERTAAKARTEEFMALAKSFKPFNRSDDYRDTDAGYYGGFQLLDNELTWRLRSAGKEILKTVGKQILTGKFNLTTVSFPIKCMCPKSIMEAMALIAMSSPVYLNAAALTTDPVERMKLVMTSTLAYIFPAHMFEKPLNPILGETYQAVLEDGTEIFMEQTSHHPPNTHMQIYGPNNLYNLNGWTNFSAKAWFNSVTLYVEGGKSISF